MTMITTEQ